MAIQLVLLSVDLEEAAADGGEVGSQSGMLVPAVAHQLQQLRVDARVVARRDRRTKRRRLAASHTDHYICTACTQFDWSLAALQYALSLIHI